jgi:soluble lytic murein transglycosylase-like protein
MNSRISIKKILASLTIATAVVINISGQSRDRYVFDNFDTARGVEVVKVQAAPKATPKTAKRLVQKTVQRTMNMSDAVSARDFSQNISLSGAKMARVASNSLNGFTTGNLLVDAFIVDSAARYEMDPLLIYSQMNQESSFNLRATSNKGASGLMQLMPGTARRFGVSDIYDPQQNIDAGVRYMRWLLDTFNGDLSLALAGYNAGEGAVWKYGNVIPPYDETQEYVRRILERYYAIRGSNGAMYATRISSSKGPKYDKKGIAPLTVRDASPITVKGKDGTIRLVNK